MSEELKLSDDKTVTVEVLNGLDEDGASVIYMGLCNTLPTSDSFNTASFLEAQRLRLKVFAACSVSKLNGQPEVPKLNQMSYRTFMGRLTGAEVRNLIDWGRQHYADAITEDDLKNESSATEEPTPP